MFEQIAENYLQETIAAFESYKKLAEKSFAQLSDEEFFKAIDAEANSIAAVAKHIGGNLRSRWTDFLTTDGEKPDRNRDSEFVAENDTRQSVMQIWETGWQTLFDSLNALAPEDLVKTITIRSEIYTMTRAALRSLAHTASHIGQIILLAKHFRSGEWQTLSVPKNKSAEFNNWLMEKEDKGNYLEATQEFTCENQK
ncbi:MAG: DUF1572 family protein [Pyrinomonadaceae bacterium]